ncbi:MAG: STT3 domain-containing protein [Thermoanaerobaculia bacterium]
MKFSRALAVVAVLAAASLGFGLRLSTRAQLAAGPRVRALGSDDNYHLRRARFAVAHFPRTIVFDPLMNFPSGGVPIWPPLYDLLLAAPSRAMHGAAAPPETIEREAAWVPPALAAGTILIAGAIGAELFGPAGAATCALFLAVCPGHILWTQYGHTDQHAGESFFGSLALFLFLRARGRAGPDLRRDALREAAAGIALAAAVLAWQGAIYWAAIFALALALEAVRTRESILRPALLFLALPALVVAAATAFWLGPFRPPLTYVSFGFFQPLFLGALAGGTVAIDTALRAARGQMEWKSGDALARGLAVGAAAAELLPYAPALTLGLARGVGYVLGTTSEVSGSSGYVSYPRDWLKGIFEARPLFADGPGLAWKSLSAAFFLSPVAAAVWARRYFRGDRPGLHAALAVWAAVTLLLAVAQRLNVYYAALLAAVVLAEASRWAERRIGGPPLRRFAVPAAIALVLAAPMFIGLAGVIRAVRVPGSDLFATLEWMRRELPHPIDAYDPRLLDAHPPDGLARASSVLAPWSLGHLVLYNAELPVVANNFGYGFLDSIRFFLAPTEEEAMALARSRKARWVLVTDLVPRMNDYAGYLGRPPLLTVAAGQAVPTPAYFQTLQSRLYDFDGAGGRVGSQAIAPLASFRLRFHSASGIRRGGRWIPRWKVFEISE